MSENQPTPTALAICVESSLNQSLDGFNLAKARLYGVNVVDPDGVPTNMDGALRISFLGEKGDVYDLLEAPTSAIVKMFDAAVVLTCGWAAPISGSENPDDIIPPSEHPSRRRVRLVVVVCDHGVASVLRFADTPHEIITDPGSARGSLADAVQSLWTNSGSKLLNDQMPIDKPQQVLEQRFFGW